VNTPAQRPILSCGDRQFPLGARTYVMGVLNVTPDSFSDGGRFDNLGRAIDQALAMMDAGADIIDVGGESTRPGAAPVPPDQEVGRVLPVIEALVKEGIQCISIDTRNAATAHAALESGAAWLNDVSALNHDPEMAALCAKAQVSILMHARGKPKTMQEGQIVYGDVITEVRAHLEEACQKALDAGAKADSLIVDPGIGFGKRLEHNLQLTRALTKLRGRAAAVLYGPSRKRFIGELTGIEKPADRDAATVGAVVAAVGFGADLVRVHDVPRTVEALKVADPLLRAQGGQGGLFWPMGAD
jgi:dihydropteroate synthase